MKCARSKVLLALLVSWRHEAHIRSIYDVLHVLRQGVGNLLALVDRMQLRKIKGNRSQSSWKALGTVGSVKWAILLQVTSTDFMIASQFQLKPQSSVHTHYFLPSCPSRGFPAPHNFELNHSVNALIQSSKSDPPYCLEFACFWHKKAH